MFPTGSADSSLPQLAHFDQRRLEFSVSNDLCQSNAVDRLCGQLYTVSQDGTLCVWESDTQLDGLILAKSKDKDGTTLTPGHEDQEVEEGEVIRGKPEVPKDEKRKTVRYKQISKYDGYFPTGEYESPSDTRSLFQTLFQQRRGL